MPSDLQATKLARAMVTKYGMSEALGKVAINYEDNGRSVSSETRNLVETEVGHPPARPLPVTLKSLLGALTRMVWNCTSMQEAEADTAFCMVLSKTPTWRFLACI